MRSLVMSDVVFADDYGLAMPGVLSLDALVREDDGTVCRKTEIIPAGLEASGIDPWEDIHAHLLAARQPAAGRAAR